VVLVVIASVLHALWNFLFKKCYDKHVFAWLMLSEAALICLPMLALSEEPSLPLLGLVCAVVGGLMGAFHFLLLGLAYRVGDLSRVYPLARGLMPVFTLAWAVVFLGERPSSLGLTGIALVVMGIYVLHLREASSKGLVEPLRALRDRASQLAILLSLVLSVMALVDKVGISVVDLAIYMPLIYTLRPAFLTPYVLYAKKGRIRAGWRADKQAILVAGAACPLNYLMILYVMRTVEVSYVVALRQLSVVFGVLMGCTLLGESYGRVRLAGSILIFLGAFLISLVL